MQARSFQLIMAALLVALPLSGALADTENYNWPNWRGPNADGVAIAGNPPITWSETENIKWKVAMPDAGDGTPIVWGDKMIFLTAIATAEDKRTPPPKDAGREIFTPMPTVPYAFNVMCIDKNTGETLWTTKVAEAIPHEGHHPSSSLAAYSPITDGELIWASFGSRGIHCLDLDGNIKWSQPLPEMLIFRAFGEGSSPAIAGDAVIIQHDHEGDSKIFAFDKLTGDKLWEKDRDEATSWSSPIPVEVDGQMQVITSGSNRIRSYDAKTGEIIWHSAGLTRGAVPTPVIGFNNVYCMTGYQDPSVIAIELGYTGDLTDSDAISWHVTESAPYIPCPVLYDNRLYMIENMKGILSCYNAETGEALYEGQRLQGMKQLYSSPIGAAGRLYISDRAGVTMVVKHADTFEVLATNTLEDSFDSSAVVIGDELFLKGEKYLYCIAEQ